MSNPVESGVTVPLARRAGRMVGVAALCSALSIGVVTAPAADEADGEAAARQGASLLAPFKAALMRALGTGLAGGPVAAIDTCRIEAPALAAGTAAGDVEIGRTSDRLRNPANTAPPWVVPVLRAYLDGAARTPQVLDLENGRTGYVEPIVVQPMCLACHGRALDTEVQASLARHYPGDAATGYDVGELRGVIWVAFERSAGEHAAAP